MLVDLEKTLIQSTATIDCQSQDTQLKLTSDLIHSSQPSSHPINRNRTTTTSNSPSCEILKSSFISPSNIVGDSNEKVVLNDVRPFSALYDIICKEKEIENIMSNAQHTEQSSEKFSYLNMGLTDQNGSDQRSASAKEDLNNTSSETERLLDRTIHSQSTSQINSKFTHGYKDKTESESDWNNGDEQLETTVTADGVAVKVDTR